LGVALHGKVVTAPKLLRERGDGRAQCLIVNCELMRGFEGQSLDCVVAVVVGA
jgi:hypothetical protein